MDYTQLEQVLLWLTGIGAPAVVGYLLSIVIENWKGWSTLPREVKFIIPMVASVLIAIGAKALLGFPDVISQISPYFTVIMTAVLTYLSTQKGYMTVIDKGYGTRFDK